MSEGSCRNCGAEQTGRYCAQCGQKHMEGRHTLRSLGYDIGGSETPIIPVQIGEFDRMLHFWKVIFDAGVFTNPVTPPAVPENSCRLRISLMATHTDEHIDFVLDAFASAGRRMAVI